MGSRAASGPPVIVTLPPEVDAANAEQACGILYEAVASGAAVVIVDLTATTFCDSAGIHQILMAHQRAVAVGAQLRMAVSPGGSVARVVDLLGIGQLLAVYANTGDAAAAPNTPTAGSSSSTREPQGVAKVDTVADQPLSNLSGEGVNRRLAARMPAT